MSTQIPQFFSDMSFRTGCGVLADFLIAFSAKKLAKKIAVIAGLMLSLVAYLNYRGIIFSTVSVCNSLLGGGFAIGFVLGLKTA